MTQKIHKENNSLIKFIRKVHNKYYDIVVPFVEQEKGWKRVLDRHCSWKLRRWPFFKQGKKGKDNNKFRIKFSTLILIILCSIFCCSFGNRKKAPFKVKLLNFKLNEIALTSTVLPTKENFIVFSIRYKFCLFFL